MAQPTQDTRGNVKRRRASAIEQPATTTIPIEWGGAGQAPTRRGEALWDFDATGGPQQQQSSESSAPSSAAATQPSLELELRRAHLMTGLREHYAKVCKQHMFFEKPPDDSMDRWLLEQLAQPRGQADPSAADPLMPKPQVAESSRVLLRELVAEVPMRIPTRCYGRPAYEALEKYYASARSWVDRLPEVALGLAEDTEALGVWVKGHSDEARGRRRADECVFRRKLDELARPGSLTSRFRVAVEPLAVRVMRSMVDEAQRLVERCRQAADPTSDASAGDVTLEEPEGPRSAAVVRFGGDELRVSALHFGKLRLLYQHHNSPAGDDAEGYERTFRRRLYAMLRRYVTFIGIDPSSEGCRGGNMHAAAPETVFSWLKKELGVRCEVFASPLNCYFPTFFSAFPDVDSCFGSLGSFFEAPSLPAGSYEVGPPYTEEVMELTARKLLKLLSEATAVALALSFVVFVPDWPGATSLELLDGPSFRDFRRSRNGGPYVLARGKNHHYISGVQFFADSGADASRRYYTVPHGTRVYVLQTSRGAECWPLTEQRERELLDRLRSPGQ